MVEVLKQGQYVPMDVEKQVVIILAAGKGALDDISQNNVHSFEVDLLKHMEAAHNDLLEQIRTEGSLSDELSSQIEKAVNEFKSGYQG